MFWIKRLFFMVMGIFLLSNLVGCSTTEKKKERKIVDYKEYPKLKNYKLALTLVSHKIEIPKYDEKGKLLASKDYKYSKDFTFKRGAEPTFGFCLRNSARMSRKRVPLAKVDKMPGSVNIPEWRKRSQDNVYVYYRKAGSRKWVKDSPDVPRYSERLPLILVPGNLIFVGKKLNFIKTATPGTYYIKAKLNLMSVDVKSKSYKIKIK